MPQCGMGHEMAADAYVCSQCGMGRAAQAAPAPATLANSATTTTLDSPPPLPQPAVQAPVAPVQYSPDGRWLWNGGSWTPVVSSPQPGAPVSATMEAVSSVSTPTVTEHHAPSADGTLPRQEPRTLGRGQSGMFHLLPAPGSPLDPRPLLSHMSTTKRRAVAVVAAVVMLVLVGGALATSLGSGSSSASSDSASAESSQVGTHQWCAALLIRDLDYANQQTSLSEYYAKIAPMLSVLTSSVMGNTMASLANNQQSGAVGQVSDEYAGAMRGVIQNIGSLAQQMPTVSMEYVHARARIGCDADTRLTGHPASDSSDASVPPTT